VLEDAAFRNIMAGCGAWVKVKKVEKEKVRFTSCGKKHEIRRRVCC